MLEPNCTKQTPPSNSVGPKKLSDPNPIIDNTKLTQEYTNPTLPLHTYTTKDPAKPKHDTNIKRN